VDRDKRSQDFTGWPQSRRKKSEFSRLFQSHKLTFPQVIATKGKCNDDLHQGSFHINSSNITGHHRTLTFNWAGSLLPEILLVLLTQSTDVLHKYLNDKLKILCYNFFPEVAQNENSPSFPCSEKSVSIPGFPGLWPPCFSSKALISVVSITSNLNHIRT